MCLRPFYPRLSNELPSAAEESAVKAIRFGAFSYLVEGVRAISPQAGIQLAARFLTKNPMPPGGEIGMNVLEHFADIIKANRYDWEGLSIAFLDPEAAHQDRIRENLKLSPAERLERHEAFMSQIRRAKRVWKFSERSKDCGRVGKARC